MTKHTALIVKKLRIQNKDRVHPYIYRAPRSYPQLYLERIENKDKLLPDAPEYIPTVQHVEFTDKPAQRSEVADYDDNNSVTSSYSSYVSEKSSIKSNQNKKTRHQIEHKKDQRKLLDDTRGHHSINAHHSVDESNNTDDSNDEYGDYSDNESETSTTTSKQFTSQRIPQPPMNQKSTLRIGTHDRRDKHTQPSIQQSQRVQDKTQLKFQYLDRINQYKYGMSNHSVADIPFMNHHTPIEEVDRYHGIIERRFKVESNIKYYKQLLIMSFQGIEFLLNYFNMTCPDFTNQQLSMMPSYNDLLFEMACKMYENELESIEQWSIEMRLVKAVGLNTAIIILGAWFMKRSGFDLTNVIRTMTTSNMMATPTMNTQPTQPTQNIPSTSTGQSSQPQSVPTTLFSGFNEDE
jgi:hypothetical protein